jgi:hypothetical protein
MKLVLPEKDHIYGFKTTSPSALLFKNDIPFYYRTNRDGVLHFNMPGGATYEVLAGQLQPSTPVIYPTLNLDNRDNFDDVRKLTYIISPNENRVSVDLKKRISVIDPAMAKLPEWVIKYFIGHEYAHNFHRGNGQISELACDKLACDTMLKIGYNPNQSIAAIRLALSNRPAALKRKAGILYELNSIKNGIITGS